MFLRNATNTVAADLSLLSIIHLQNLSQTTQEQPQNSSFSTYLWIWNPRQQSQDEDDNDSWEVRAFAEDIANIMGSTWPPRSYTCTFCRKEFQSAQALGGHMNVHRRGRARLRQLPMILPTAPVGGAADPSSSCTSSSILIIPTPEFGNNCGYCLFYPLPNPSNVFTPIMESPSSSNFTISPYLRSSILSPCPSSSINFPVETDIHTSPVLPINENRKNCNSISYNNKKGDDGNKDLVDDQELDLELRLG